MKGTGVPENCVSKLVLIKVDQKDITYSRLCYYLSESTRGTNNKTMFFSPYIYIYIYIKFTEASHHNTLNITQNRWM